MSLLLDALKEAEARKREAASPVARAAATETASPSFDADGTLALAEDYPALADQSAVRRATPPAAASPTPTSPAPDTRIAPPSTGATPPPVAPAEALLAARAARAAPIASPPSRPVAASSASSTAPAAARPVPAATSAAPSRSVLPWLVGAAAALGIVFGGLSLYDGLLDPPAAAPPQLPLPGALQASSERPAITAPPAGSAAPVTLDGAPGQSTAGPAAPEARPASARRMRGEPGTAAPDGPPADRPLAQRRSAEPASAAPARPPSRDAEPVRISVSREAAPLEVAWTAMQAGELARAEASYLEVLRAQPGQVDALLGLAVIAQSRGEDEAARRGFRRVLESVPDHPQAWAGLADLAAEGDAGTLESRLRQLLAERPSAPLHFALGNLLARQQRWADAQPEYFAAATLVPQAADYAFNVAVALERLGKAGAALPWYERALGLAGRGRAVRFDAVAVRERVAQLRSAQP